MQAAIRVAADKVAGVIADIREALVLGVLDERLCGSRGIVEIAKADIWPAEKQLADVLARRPRKNFVIKVMCKKPERSQGLHIGKIRRRNRVRGTNAGAFGWAVNIFQFGARPETILKLL